MAANHRPSYLDLYESGELERRVESLEKMLLSCNVCPLDCGNDRTRGELARCYSAALPVVSSYTPHFGEEPALTGKQGAGNIFFGYYYLRSQAQLLQHLIANAGNRWRIFDGFILSPHFGLFYTDTNRPI